MSSRMSSRIVVKAGADLNVSAGRDVHDPAACFVVAGRCEAIAAP
jgi:hypothetical protein